MKRDNKNRNRHLFVNKTKVTNIYNRRGVIVVKKKGINVEFD